MKLSKGLFLAFAGLGLFACSNEDVTENGAQIEGPADVVVKLDLPGFVNGVSRAVETGFTTNKIVTPSYVVVTVEGKKGATVEQEYTGGNITIQGVEDPTSIKVEINTKKESGENNWINVPYSTFAELNEITVAGTRMIGTVSGVENFMVSGENYIVTVPVKHTMARLEFGGIKHAAHSGGTCRFKNGNLAGVFLNHVQLHSTAATDDPKDYTEDDIKGANFFSGNGSTGWWDAITGTDFFPGGSATYPSDGGCYAYNIYPVEANNAAALPVLTLYFNSLQEQDNAPSHFVGSEGFALVKTYKVSKTTMDGNPTLKAALCGANPTELDEGTNYQVINFPAGYIYQIQTLSVPDEAVHPDLTGAGVNLVATITLIDWKIVAGSVDWK
ncbi:hypothetical protein [uncultured Bacteroides sp.]|uniref:hypothetical protein n=1 Tax=uncultured Bacteroides sp. TaxID=162156 RepID=UPI00280C295D|nr:hypothetical protein [uncultured Bacteroides sp.]